MRGAVDKPGPVRLSRYAAPGRTPVPTDALDRVADSLAWIAVSTVPTDALSPPTPCTALPSCIVVSAFVSGSDDTGLSPSVLFGDPASSLVGQESMFSVACADTEGHAAVSDSSLDLSHSTSRAPCKTFEHCDAGNLLCSMTGVIPGGMYRLAPVCIDWFQPCWIADVCAALVGYARA